MNLYLVQHGEARLKDEDPDRSLSEKGMTDILKMTAFIKIHAGFKIDIIYHSGKLRAQQTADAFADQLKPSNGCNQIDGLAPMDNPSNWAAKLMGIHEDLMLVGHLPHLQKLTALLLTGDDSKTPGFQNTRTIP
jgi:phosphohistidine phosphatase